MRIKLSDLKIRAEAVGLYVNRYNGRYSVGYHNEYFVDNSHYVANSIKEAFAYLVGYTSLYYNQKLIIKLAEATDAK